MEATAWWPMSGERWWLCVRSPGWLYVPLLLALVADGWTTWRIFSVEGAEGELHPGIRLMAYMCGPLAGVLLGKLGQMAGLLVLALWVRVWWFRLVVVVATLLYGVAAYLNHTAYVQYWG